MSVKYQAMASLIVRLGLRCDGPWVLHSERTRHRWEGEIDATLRPGSLVHAPSQGVERQGLGSLAGMFP